MSIRLESGQSILEYTLVLGAVIAVIVFVLLNPSTGIKKKVQDTYVQAGDAITQTANGMNTGVFTGTSSGS